MHGYIGLTDFDWYSFLAARPGLPEINFWQPSSDKNFGAIDPGEPFFFKLKSPHKAIAGFGTFARYERATVTSAWDAFGEANGAPDFATLDQRIRQYRAKKKLEGQTYAIGCIMISQPVFFEKALWVEGPSDWHSSIVQGKTYDLDQEGEGRRIYDTCISRIKRYPSPTNDPLLLTAHEPTARYGSPQLVQPRLGQGAFRLAIMAAYEGACAVTQEHSEPVLEAAHIKPFSVEGAHDTRNGLLLRTDIHRLFDKGYVTVTPDHTFQVSPLLEARFKNGKTYYALQGKKIFVPKRAQDRPSADFLSWHNENVFLRR